MTGRNVTWPSQSKNRAVRDAHWQQNNAIGMPGMKHLNCWLTCSPRFCLISNTTTNKGIQFFLRFAHHIYRQKLKKAKLHLAQHVWPQNIWKGVFGQKKQIKEVFYWLYTTVSVIHDKSSIHRNVEKTDIPLAVNALHSWWAMMHNQACTL